MMPYPYLDRSKLHIKSLQARRNKIDFKRDYIENEPPPPALSAAKAAVIGETARRIVQAREKQRSVILAFGAHAIKNGLAPVFIQLMQEGWVTHLATNGAGIIHDWEFSFLGQSGEDVRAFVEQGQFGLWQETGYYINLALVVGAYEGLGYGEAVGAMIEREGLEIPSGDELKRVIVEALEEDPDRAAAAADLLSTIRTFAIASGWLTIAHPQKSYSVQAAAYRLKIPFTGHPMIGHDVTYNHPMNHCAALGRAAQRDFLSFAHSVNNLEDGVYLSVGSAVMSPMIFEKSLSMAQNLHIQRGERISRHHMLIVDLAESTWDWQRDGEPPVDDPAYYLRYCKTFSRMGGTMQYLSMDNRDFLLSLLRALEKGPDEGRA
jgi:hypothetical protein